MFPGRPAFGDVVCWIVSELGHASERENVLTMAAHSQPPGALFCRIGASLVRRDLATTAALFARSIDRHLAKHDLKTSRAAPATSKGDHAE